MIKFAFLLLVLHIKLAVLVPYDSFSGNKVSKEVVKAHDKANNTFWCVQEIEPCDPYEWRRIDGSCNNLENPSRGVSHTPLFRELPADFGPGFSKKPAKSGAAKPLERLVRTTVLPQGKVPDRRFTQLVSYFTVSMGSDLASLHDTLNYVLWKTYCCEPKGKTDSECVPNAIPDDDPVRRFDDVRCMNLTKPITFQYTGCVPNNTTPERIVSATSLLDLSMVYGKSNELIKKARLFEGGLLKYEEENGKIWPPSTKTKVDLCLLNQKPRESRCHAIPEDGNNALVGQNMMLIWLWRHHNLIAQKLAKINPCWNDDQLFYTAREMNIATYLQIFYYELMPQLMGYENLVREGVISQYYGFREIYDETVLPQTSVEYLQILRWFHTVQDGTVKMYDIDGSYLKQYPTVNLTLRTGYLAVDNNIVYMTQGAFRQRSAKIDHLVDPDIAELALGPHQKANDLPTSDLAKNKLTGLPSYTQYRKYCFGDHFDDFDDLIHAIDEERIELLKDLYKDVDDIDLMAGVWSEKLVSGGFVPQTFYCLVVKQMLRNAISDRHWYERAFRPHAFTLPQLLEIRKSSMARFLCDVGDKVTHIQPRAFLKAAPGNEICNCHTIEDQDIYAWMDPSCEANYDKKNDSVVKNI